MSFVLDIILIAIAALNIILGVRRGFFKSVMSLISGIAALLVSFAFSPSLSVILNEKFILPSLSSGISQTLASIADGGVNASGETVYDLSLLTASEQFQNVLERFGANKDAVSEMVDQIGVGTRAAVDKVAELVAKPIANMLSDIVAFIIIFVVSLIVLKLIVWIIGLIFELPVFKGLDRSLGLVFGIISALLFIWIFSMLASTVVTALGAAFPSVFNTEIIENSHLVKFFSEYNVISSISSALGYID